MRLEFLSGFCHLCQAAIAHKVHTIKVIHPKYLKKYAYALAQKKSVSYICFGLQDMKKKTFAKKFSQDGGTFAPKTVKVQDSF